MPSHNAKAVSPHGQIELKFSPRSSKRVITYQCLIVSANPQRRQLLDRAALDGGWETILCGDAEAAISHVSRSRVQMAVVDLELQRPELFRPVVEHFTACNGLLLIVCGNEGDVGEEVWVRQLGAWLYLPGMVDGGSFAQLCGEAKQIAQRLWNTTHAERAGPLLVGQRNNRRS